MGNKKIIINALCFALGVSCSVQESDLQVIENNSVFYASVEQPSEDKDTRVFVGQDFKVFWDEGDKVSIFNLKDANDEYRFTGKTGDNGGSFELVKDFSEEGVSIDYRYAVYPYSQSTSIDTKGILSVSLSAEQTYREHSFGPGTNLMVAATDSKDFQFKNACGYLVLKLYGEGESVSSITLMGNNGEKLAGEALVTMPLDGVPTAVMANDATTEITLRCTTPIALGSTAEESTLFWFVLPPVTFSKGFTIVVKRKDGTVFTKTTSNSVTISRNHLSKMSAFDVLVEGAQPSNVIYYTSCDGTAIVPYDKSAFGATILSNNYADNIGILRFDKEVTRVGSNAFLSRSTLTSISLPETVKSIGGAAFKNCSSLSGITLPNAVASIGKSAFESCSHLGVLTIPEGVTSIGETAFSNAGVTEFRFKPAVPPALGALALDQYAYDNPIIVPANSVDAYKAASTWKNYSKRVVAEGLSYIYYTSSDGEIVVPSYASALKAFCISNEYKDGYGIITVNGIITIISDYAFSNCSNLTSITLPESITDIGDYAFRGCSSLTDITIPEAVKSIGINAFENCTSLSYIILPDGIPSIKDYAFSGCSSLSSITLPENVTSIGKSAFYACTSLTSLTIPESVTSLGQKVFSSCSKLTSLTVLPVDPPSGSTLGLSSLVKIFVPPGSVEAYKSKSPWSSFINRIVGIGEYTYIRYTSSDGNIITPNSTFSSFLLSNEYENGQGVITIAGRLSNLDCAFNDNLRLTSILIPEGVTSIVGGDFKGCSGLTSISIPEGVTEIGYQAFMSCSSLTSIYIPEGVRSIGSDAFRNCYSLTSIKLPASVTCIESALFLGCSSLTSITIPDGVTRIRNLSFNGCSSLTSITIPKNVSGIETSAFKGCTALQRIDVMPAVPPLGEDNMFVDTGLCPIYIPAGSEDLYADADYWAEYALRMRVEGSDSPIAYFSTDYSRDGEVVQLQSATVGKGINIIFMGDGFLDKDMEPGGKYEQKMINAMEQFFSYEPYTTYRNRFNVFTVKVISKNNIYGDENSDRRLTYEQGNSIYFRSQLTSEYAGNVPNPYNQPLKICTICNTEKNLGRSFCSMVLSTGWASCIIYDPLGTIINHELGGHGFAFLADEYEEYSGTFSEQTDLDEKYNKYGYGPNVDWRNDVSSVKWSHFLSDNRYSQEGIGVYEGAYYYPKGIYRPTMNSVMRNHRLASGKAFNAPSREQIYKTIMKYSEGSSWSYDYEEFVTIDEAGRNQANSAFNSVSYAPSKNRQKELSGSIDAHIPPVILDQPVKEICVDQNGKITLIH